MKLYQWLEQQSLPFPQTEKDLIALYNAIQSVFNTVVSTQRTLEVDSQITELATAFVALGYDGDDAHTMALLIENANPTLDTTIYTQTEDGKAIVIIIIEFPD
jgi:hypothetical protein